MRAHPLGVAPKPLIESEIRSEGDLAAMTCLVMERVILTGRSVTGRITALLPSNGCARAHPVGVAPEPLSESVSRSKVVSHRSPMSGGVMRRPGRPIPSSLGLRLALTRAHCSRPALE